MIVLPRKENPLDKRVCYNHAGAGFTRVNCDVEVCMCYVHVPLNVGKDGNPEKNEWKGCVHLLLDLVEYAKVSNIPIDTLLSMNR